MKRSMPVGATVFVTLALLAPLVAGGVLVVAAGRQSPLESAAETVPVVAEVAEAKRFGSVNVSITVEPASAATVATQASGTVTRLNIGPATTVRHGQVVLVVDAKQVLAYTSASPLYRDIARSATGGDVKIAQRLLQDLGLLGKAHAVDGKADAATEAAIKAFNKKYGYGTGNGILSLASLIWVGPAPARVAKLSVAVGQAIGPGTTLFEKPTGAAGIGVVETGDVPRGTELELVLNELTVPYAAGSGRVTDPDAVSKIAAALGSATEGGAVLRRVTPLLVGTVPSSAVVTDDAGRLCIFPDLTGAAVPVTPLAIVPGDMSVMNGALGLVDLDRALVGKPVLINPRDVRQSLSCG